MSEAATARRTWIEWAAAEVRRFWTEVLGQDVPERPTALEGDRFQHACDHLGEELREFEGSHGDLEAQTDALVDLIYVALGRLVEMGVAPGPAFEAVHEANMRKARGANAKRPSSGGVDATKPAGWEPPDLLPLLHVSARDVRDLGRLPPLIRAALDVRAERGRQYNRGDVGPRDYFPLGDASHVQMIHLKAKRILAEFKGAQADGRQLTAEEVTEHLRDLVNYACFMLEDKLGELP